MGLQFLSGLAFKVLSLKRLKRASLQHRAGVRPANTTAMCALLAALTYSLLPLLQQTRMHCRMRASF